MFFFPLLTQFLNKLRHERLNFFRGRQRILRTRNINFLLTVFARLLFVYPVIKKSVQALEFHFRDILPLGEAVDKIERLAMSYRFKMVF